MSTKAVGVAHSGAVFRTEDLKDLIMLRRFIDPELDLSTLEGIADLIRRLNDLPLREAKTRTQT